MISTEFPFCFATYFFAEVKRSFNYGLLIALPSSFSKAWMLVRKELLCNMGCFPLIAQSTSLFVLCRLQIRHIADHPTRVRGVTSLEEDALKFVIASIALFKLNPFLFSFSSSISERSSHDSGAVHCCLFQSNEMFVPDASNVLFRVLR